MTNNLIPAYPLQWPSGWPRSRTSSDSRYGDHSIARATSRIQDEVRLLGGDGLVISTNLRLRLDGLPISNQSQPSDKGVAIYFKRDLKPMCFACDRWNKIEHNLWGIAEGIAAIRQLDRCGTSEMLERAFSGFVGLPSPQGHKPWWEVLGIPQSSDSTLIERAYKAKAKSAHPDVGGSDEEFKLIQRAYEEAQVL